MKALALILAGGLSRRMGGGDKALMELSGKPMLAHVIERLKPQIPLMLINANGDPARFQSFGLPVIPDLVLGYVGPLAGIHAGMQWCQKNDPSVTHLLSVPADTPFLPLDLYTRLASNLAGDARILVAASQVRAHPVIALWPVSLANDLFEAVSLHGIRRIDQFTARYPTHIVDFPLIDGVDPFFNANSTQDLDLAEGILNPRRP